MTDARRKVLIEGYSVDQILAFPNEALDQFVFCGEPIVFKAGSAEILGKFERLADRIILELAHIDGGGEGALPALGAFATRYAAREHLAFVEWRVHAVHCANPIQSCGECSSGADSSSGRRPGLGSVTTWSRGTEKN